MTQGSEQGERDAQFMALALKQAEKAFQAGEVPIGAVVVRDGEVIGQGWNQSITLNDPTAHAEVMALRDAAQHDSNYRLPDTTIYITLEPCTMCVGALMHARVTRVVFGALEPKAGAVQSQQKLHQASYWNHMFKLTGGVLADECKAIIQVFFAERRKQKKALKGGDDKPNE